MNTKLLLGLIGLFILSTAIAGDSKGNGGNTVNCGNVSTFFDFYVNQEQYPVTNTDEFTIANAVLDKMAVYDSTRAEMYRERLKSFMNSANFVKDADLGVVHDTGVDIEIPSNCTVVQTIIQKLVVYGNEKRYLVSEPQWMKLSSFDRAGLMIHELLYWEIQAERSNKLGKFNAYLFSHMNSGYDKVEYFNNLKYAGVKWVYLYGIPMDATVMTVTPEKISSMATVGNMPFKILNQEVTSVQQILTTYSSGVPRMVNYKGQITFGNKDFDFVACSANSVCKMTLNADGSMNSLDQVVIKNRVNGSEQRGVVTFDKDGEPHVSK